MLQIFFGAYFGESVCECWLLFVNTTIISNGVGVRNQFQIAYFIIYAYYTVILFISMCCIYVEDSAFFVLYLADIECALFVLK